MWQFIDIQINIQIIHLNFHQHNHTHCIPKCRTSEKKKNQSTKIIWVQEKNFTWDPYWNPFVSTIRNKLNENFPNWILAIWRLLIVSSSLATKFFDLQPLCAIDIDTLWELTSVLLLLYYWEYSQSIGATSTWNTVTLDIFLSLSTIHSRTFQNWILCIVCGLCLCTNSCCWWYFASLLLFFTFYTFFQSIVVCYCSWLIYHKLHKIF